METDRIRIYPANREQMENSILAEKEICASKDLRKKTLKSDMEFWRSFREMAMRQRLLSWH